MRSYPANDKILMRMLSYGMVLGAIAGGIVTCVMGLVHGYALRTVIFDALASGMLAGLVFGCIVGLSNGFIMAIIVPRYLTDLNTEFVRIGLGLTTTIVTLILSPLLITALTFIDFRLERNGQLAVVCLFAVLSVFACQRTITHYIRETGLHKSKHKLYA